MGRRAAGVRHETGRPLETSRSDDSIDRTLAFMAIVVKQNQGRGNARKTSLFDVKIFDEPGLVCYFTPDEAQLRVFTHSRNCL